MTVTIEELEQLRLDQRRFHRLVKAWSAATGERPADVIRDVDRLLTEGDGFDSFAATRRVRRRPNAGADRKKHTPDYP